MTSSDATPVRLPSSVLVFGATALAVLFAPTLYQLSQVYLLDDNYQHGFLVLPIAIALAWMAARAHPLAETPVSGPARLLGMSLLVLGVFAQLLAALSRFVPIEFLAMTLILSGLVIYLGGAAWARHFAFPIFFLIFLFPLPATLTSNIAVALQNVVAATSNQVLSFFFLAYRRGNNIHIAGVDEPMFVAQECSGIRQAIAFIALAALVSYLFRLGTARGLLLVVLAVPVAIFANVVRVTLMGLGLVYFGPSWFTTQLHDLPALFTLPMGVLCFFGIVWLVAPGAAPPPPPAASPAASPASETNMERQPT